MTCGLVVCLLASGLGSRQARAQEEKAVRATIVSIDDDRVFLDLSGGEIEPGEVLTVYRRIEVRHPVSGKKLTDRFAIGQVSIAQPGESLSLAAPEGTPERPFAVGDTVEGARTVSPKAAKASASGDAVVRIAPAPTTVARSAAHTAQDRETAELLRYWQASLGRTPEYRVRLYKAYLQRFPKTVHATRIGAEMTYLAKLDAAMTRATERREPKGAPKVEAAPIRRAEEGEPIAVALAYRTDAKIRNLILHARPRGASLFVSSKMEMDGRGHARGTIPGGAVRAQGVEYFVEAVLEDGSTRDAVGTSGAPKEVEVYRAARPIPKDEPTTRVRVSSEVVSFDGTSGRDFFFVNEGDFFQRVDFGVLYGVRIGYGRYDGKGGTVEELDELALEPERAGFSYGYVETELAMAPLLGMALRGTLGIGRPESADQERDGVTGGAQLRVRIGPGDGTRLVVAGEVLPEVGQRAYLGLRWEVLPRLPMSTEVHVTDQPVNSDELAVRLVQEVGFRVTDRIVLAVRPSYQLRTIRHAGPGVGLAASFDW